MILNQIRNVIEKCVYCDKSIRAGHPFITCKNCNCILHKKCRTQENIVKFRDENFCISCIDRFSIIRYNPLYQPNHFNSNEMLNEEPIHFIESLENISNTLENCKPYTTPELSNLLTEPISKLTSLYFQNIDGNSTNFDQFVLHLAAIKQKFSFIGLAETNTDCNNEQLYQIDGYTSCYQSRIFLKDKNHLKAKGSGVCLYINNIYNFNRDNKLSVCTENIEALFVNITNLPEPVTVGVIYRPPSGNLKEFNLHYGNILSELKGKKCYISGDFNVNLHNLSSEDERNFEETIFTAGFTPVISTVTHEMPHCNKTCIDNIHTNDVDSSMISGVLNCNISHHKPVFLLKETPVTTDSKRIERAKVTLHYNYSNANLDKLCEEIDRCIDQFHNECDTFDAFLCLFQDKIDASCKLETPKTTKRNSIVNPWISPGLINCIEKKARLYFEWNKTRTTILPDGDEMKYLKYKDYRKVLKGLIKLAKASYYVNKFQDCGNNSKKTWKLINEIRGKSKTITKADFVIDGSRVMCRRVIACKFNEYFASLAYNLNQEILANCGLPIAETVSFEEYLSKSVKNSIFLRDTDPEEIIEIINDFKTGKASDIPICVLKRSAKLISVPLSRLYNNCMHKGEFPNAFKTGKITPVFKKGNKECIENYRPVSILPVFGKVFEKIIYKRLYSFLSSNGVLHDQQFGFRKGHSTTHALHKSVNEITKSVSNNNHVLGIFIDLSKAFDTLDHSILLRKLENYGIRGQALTLMKSYLTSRLQCVSFHDTTSEVLEVKYGVPQGSILGPLLFLLYVNDIVNCYSESDCKFVLYADDTNIFITGPSKEKAFIKANKILRIISNYMKSNLLHINMTKCCFVHFQPKFTYDETCARTRPFTLGKDESRSIFINGQEIKKVSSTKFLGIIIDENLNWNAHRDHLVKKLRSTTGAISRIRKSIPSEYYKDIYSSLFESHLGYGITVWGATLQEKSCDRVFITQKHCIRLLFGNLEAYLGKQQTCARARPYYSQKLGSHFYEKEHTKPVFNRLQILTVQNLFKYHCITEIFKIMKFRTPYSLYELIKLSARESSYTIILPPKIETFIWKASLAWNTIHKYVLNSNKGLTTSVTSIKHRSKAIILECQALHDPEEWKPDNFILLPKAINFSHNNHSSSHISQNDPHNIELDIQ